MKELTYFYLSDCPHCRRAQTFLKELRSENPEYAAVPIRSVEESEEPELAGRYDYYYVPTFYVGQRKLHEGVITRDDVERALKACLE